MKDIIQKLSTYNIFNYLLPGIIFVILLRFFTTLNVVIEEELIGAFLYYFIGMIISRIGSLIVEPLLKKIKIIEFSNYKKFITASSIDDKVELFSEINNMYRTFLSMLIILLIIVIYENTPMLFELSHTTKFVIVLLSLIILFLLSYRKQTEYINKRIDSQSNEG